VRDKGIPHNIDECNAPDPTISIPEEPTQANEEPTQANEEPTQANEEPTQANEEPTQANGTSTSLSARFAILEEHAEVHGTATVLADFLKTMEEHHGKWQIPEPDQQFSVDDYVMWRTEEGRWLPRSYQVPGIW
jgi:hypothetical protein